MSADRLTDVCVIADREGEGNLKAVKKRDGNLMSFLRTKKETTEITEI